MPLHPKILAALYASIAVAIVAVANAEAEVYPQWANIILVFVPVITGWFPKSPVAEKPA